MYCIFHFSVITLQGRRAVTMETSLACICCYTVTVTIETAVSSQLATL